MKANTKKKFYLLIIPFILAAILIACDTTTENSSAPVGTSSSASTSTSASGTSAEPSSEPDNVSTRTVSGIAVLVDGSDTLEKIGLYCDAFSAEAEVTVKGDKNVIDSLLSSDISAVIDVSTATEAGTSEFLVQYKAPDGVDIVSAQPLSASVEIKKKDTTIIPPDNDEAYIGNRGILISGNRGMEQYGGTAKAGTNTGAKVNQFKAALTEAGINVNVYALCPPLASAFYAPSKYPNSIANHKNCFGALADSLVDVKYVDVLAALAGHVDEEIYARTDHHWNALGAYYAAQQLARVAGTPFDDLSTFTSNSESGYLGTLATWSQAPELKNNPETFTWYIPSRAYTVEYSSKDKFTNTIYGKTLFSGAKGYTKFIYGDSYATHIYSDLNTGRSLLLIKDSYGNALAPFLVGSYDHVYIVDSREFKLNVKTFITEYGITDVCLSMSAFAVTGDFMNKVNNMLNY